MSTTNTNTTDFVLIHKNARSLTDDDAVEVELEHMAASLNEIANDEEVRNAIAAGS